MIVPVKTVNVKLKYLKSLYLLPLKFKTKQVSFSALLCGAQRIVNGLTLISQT